MAGYKAMAVPMAVYESAARNSDVVEMKDVLDLKIEDYQKCINRSLKL